MKRPIGLIIWITLSINAFALPPEIEVDRLLLQAKATSDAGDFDNAIQSFKEAEKLNVKVPETFYFHYGNAYSGAKDWFKARDAYEKYLQMNGSRGKFYREALESYNKAELQGKADRISYNKLRTDYDENIQRCPDRYWEEMESKKKRLAAAEKDCENQWGNFCDEYEQKHGRVNPNGPSGVARERAQRNLDSFSRTSANEWCAGRYTAPTLPRSLR